MARLLAITLNPAIDVTIRLPRLAPGEVNRSQSMSARAAGKGLNVAQVLADLGHTVTVSGFLGVDNAQPFEALFAERGFIDAFIRVPGETRSNMKIAEDDGRVTDINGPGVHADDIARAALAERLGTIARGHDAAIVSGSLPRGVSPEWFAELVGMLREQGLRVVLDTSGPALKAALNARPWLIKPNTDELAELVGQAVETPEAQREQAARLRAFGVSHVVISQGAEGVRWFGDELALQATPPKVPVLSTVGAGDSLVAGMVHGLLTGLPPDQTLALATAVAAEAVAQVGVGVADRVRLDALAAQVHVAQLGRPDAAITSKTR